ncbi:CG15745, partial [Drosophila busckii]
INVENKCALAAPTTFSYQRAVKRCARLEQTTRAAASTAAAAAVAATKELTTTVNTTSADPCERRRSLAEHKAQLRATFFKDLQTTREGKSESVELKVTGIATGVGIQELITKFQTMIVQQPTEQTVNAAAQQQQQQQQQRQQQHLQLKPTLAFSSAANSDEGCNAGGLSPCSSDNECDALAARKPKVTRCASSDSALGLDVELDDVSMVEVPQPAPQPQRRMTLTVTDLPLRPALLPLAEPTALPDSPLTSPTTATANVGSSSGAVGVGALGGVPSKVLLEERVVAALTAPCSSRRESTQSCISELGGLVGVRYVRTPSVVVSDYSDDITAIGISMEEMEYFRLQRARGQRRCSLEASAAAAGGGAGAKDEAQSDVSAASSCSNLYYCGSTISALDGGECIVNGVRVALARKSSHSSSGDLSAGEEDEAEAQAEEAQQQQQQQEQQEQLSELLAAAQLGE